MRKYRIVYKENGAFIPFSIMAIDIFDAHKWAKENIQNTGIQTSFIGGL